MTTSIPLSILADIQPGLSTVYGGDETFPFLTVGALMEGGRLSSVLDRLTPQAEAFTRYRVQTGDILLAARSTSVRCGIVEDAQQGTLFNSTLLRIRCDPQRLHSEILFAWICHPEGTAAIASRSRSSTSQLNLTAAALEDLLVPTPDRASQSSLASLLFAARESHQNATAAADLRLSLARELVVQKP